jgi:hypothetical protein
MIYQTYYNLKTDGFRWFILSQDIITHIWKLIFMYTYTRDLFVY